MACIDPDVAAATCQSHSMKNARDRANATLLNPVEILSGQPFKVKASPADAHMIKEKHPSGTQLPGNSLTPRKKSVKQIKKVATGMIFIRMQWG
ncbi:hypothetical protein [Austwickia chelonae]|uniref:hypothetical protein n=1 Tax=Austwickia chelonae TaxID=100225 RepID=UPI0013C32019|nr:hypothetical protein [Austwickia chelonae]